MLKFIARLLHFASHNFATPIVFFIVFNLLGIKAAIFFAVAATVIQLVYHRWQGNRLSPFFIVSSGFTVAFGMVDLLIKQPRYFRLEPFAQNAVVATALLVTAFTRWPVLEWFAEGLPHAVRPSFGPEMKSYLRKLTFVWSAYFYLKGLVFLYLAYRVNLGELVLYRSIIGTTSALLLFGGELFYRKYFLLGSGRHLHQPRQA